MLGQEANLPSARQAKPARTLFETRPYGVFGVYDVSADGQHFVLAKEAGNANSAITLVVNWPAELSVSEYLDAQESQGQVPIDCGRQAVAAAGRSTPELLMPYDPSTLPNVGTTR